MRNECPQRNIEYPRRNFSEDQKFALRESSLLSSECRSRFIKSPAKDGHVAFAALDSAECGQDIVRRSHVENSSHLATT